MAHGSFKKNYLDQANYNVSRSSIVENNSFKAHKPGGEFCESLGRRRQAISSHNTSLKFEASLTEVVVKVCQLLSEDDDLFAAYNNAQLWCNRGERMDPAHPAVINLKNKLFRVNKKAPNTVVELNASSSERASKASLSLCRFRENFNYESSSQKKVTADPQRQHPPSRFDQLAKLSDNVKKVLEKVDLLTRDISSFTKSPRQCKASYAQDSMKNRSDVVNHNKPQSGHLSVMTQPSAVKKTYSCHNPVQTLNAQNFSVKTPNSYISIPWPAKSQMFQLETSLFPSDRPNTQFQSLCEPYAFDKTQDSPIGAVKMKSKRSYQSRRSSHWSTKIKDGCSKSIELSQKTTLHELMLNVKPSDTSTDSEAHAAISRQAHCLPEPNVKANVDSVSSKLKDSNEKNKIKLRPSLLHDCPSLLEPNVKGSVDSVELKESNEKQKIKLRPSVLSEVTRSLLESKVEDFVDANQQVKQKIKLKPSKLSSVVENLTLASKNRFSLFESEGVIETKSNQNEESMTNNFEDELIKSLHLLSFNSKLTDSIDEFVQKDSVRKKEEPLNLMKIDGINGKICGNLRWQTPFQMNVKLLPESTVTLRSSNQESIKNNVLYATGDSSINPRESKESLTLSSTCSTLVGDFCNNDLKLVNKNSDISHKQESPIAYSVLPTIDQSLPETDPNNLEFPMHLTQYPAISQTSCKELKTENPVVENIIAAEAIIEVSSSNEELGKNLSQTNESKLLPSQNLKESSMPLYEKNCTNVIFDRTHSDANGVLTKIVNQINDGDLLKTFSSTNVWESDIVSSNLMSQENMSIENSNTVSSSSPLLSSSNVNIDLDCLSIPNNTDEKYNIDRGDFGDIASTKRQDLTSLVVSDKNDCKHDLDNVNYVGQSTNFVQVTGFHGLPSPTANNVRTNTIESSEIADPFVTVNSNNNYIIGCINPKDCVHVVQDSVCTSNIETITSSPENKVPSSNKAEENHIMYESYAKVDRKYDIENGGKESLSINLPVISSSSDKDEDIFVHSPYSTEKEHKKCTFQNTNIDDGNNLNVFMKNDPRTGGAIGATYYTSNFRSVEKSNSFEEINSDTDLEIELTSEAIGSDYLSTKSLEGLDELSNSQETYLHSETDQMIEDEISINEPCPFNAPSKGDDELVTQAHDLTEKHYSNIKLLSEEFNSFEENVKCIMSSTMKKSHTSHILKDNSFFVSDLCCSLPLWPSRKNIRDSEGGCPGAKSDENEDVCQTYPEAANVTSSIDLLQETGAEQKRILPGDQGRADSPLQTITNSIPISELIYSNSCNRGSVELSETELEVNSHDLLQNFEVDSYELPESIIQGSALEKEVPYYSYPQRSVSYSPGGLFLMTCNNQPMMTAITCSATTDQLSENQENCGFNSSCEETESDSPQSQVVWKREPEFGAGTKDIDLIYQSHQAGANDSAALVATDIGAYDVSYVLEDSSYFPGSRSRPPSPFLVRTRLHRLKSELALEFSKWLPETRVEAVKRVDVGYWQLDFLRRKEVYQQQYGFVDEKTMYIATGDQASHDIDVIKLLPESFNREIVFWHSLSNADANCKEPQGRVRIMLACKVLLAFVYQVELADGQSKRMKSLVKTEHSEFLPKYAVFYTFP